MTQSVNKQFSISKKLREENKSNDYFELMLGNLPLEDIIALKLEIAFRAVGIPLHGIPIWKSVPLITKDALLKFVLSITSSKKEAANYLGASKQQLNNYLKTYKTVEYFSTKEKGDGTNWRETKSNFSKSPSR